MGLRGASFRGFRGALAAHESKANMPEFDSVGVLPNGSKVPI